MTVKTYIVTADDVAPARMSELVGQLHEAGFQVTQQLPATGVIVGSAEETAISRIRSLPGVAAVEEERSFQLPPPGGPAT